LQRLAATRPDGRRDPELRGSLLALRSIARRVLQLTAEERELARELETLTRKLAPQLLDQPGVAPHAAAQLVLSWSHQGRITSEAAFARLAGAAPIPASSGQTIRYRLDRAGDRKLARRGSTRSGEATAMGPGCDGLGGRRPSAPGSSRLRKF
jgi:transposase